jgi:hypothetical protein
MELYDSATKPARSCGYFLTDPKLNLMVNPGHDGERTAGLSTTLLTPAIT